MEVHEWTQKDMDGYRRAWTCMEGHDWTQEGMTCAWKGMGGHDRIWEGMGGWEWESQLTVMSLQCGVFQGSGALLPRECREICVACALSTNQ